MNKGDQTTLIIKNKRSFSLTVVLGWTVLISSWAYSRRNTLFHWHGFNPDGINTLIFSIFFVGWLVCCVYFLDRKPKLILNNEGIWIKKNPFSRSLSKQIAWNNINYYYKLTNTGKVLEEILIIREKTSEKEIRISLLGLDSFGAEIVSYVRDYSRKYGFIELEDETA